jgi:hypothetical protein
VGIPGPDRQTSGDILGEKPARAKVSLTGFPANLI